MLYPSMACFCNLQRLLSMLEGMRSSVCVKMRHREAMAYLPRPDGWSSLIQLLTRQSRSHDRRLVGSTSIHHEEAG